MKTQVLTEYKGHRISVHANGVFEASFGDEQTVRASATSLDALKKQLDQFSREALGEIAVWVHSYLDLYVKGHITSVRKSPYAYKYLEHEYRVTWKEPRDKNEHGEQGRWEFLPPQRLFKDTPENREIIEEHNKISRQVKFLKEKMVEVAHTLVPYKEEDLVKPEPKPPQ